MILWFRTNINNPPQETKGRIEKLTKLVNSQGVYSRISPGWQSSSLQRASRVEMRNAFAFPVLRIDMFEGVMPMREANSPELIFRRASITSILIIIGMTTSPLLQAALQG